MDPASFRCEQCDRPVGPDIVECPERATDDCPYRVYQHKRFAIHRGGPALILLGLLMCVGQVGLSTALDIDQFPEYLPCLSVSLVGLGILLGLFYFFGDFRHFDRQIQIYNPHLGTLWQRTFRRGKIVDQVALIGYEPAPLPGNRLESLTYPASVVALQSDRKKWKLAHHIFTAALVSLAEREVFQFIRAEFLYAEGEEALQPASDEATFINYLGGGMRLPHQYASRAIPVMTLRYAIQPGPQFEQEMVEGRVEQRLVEAMKKQLSKARPCYIPRLIYDFYGDTKSHPDRWLIEMVEDNAAALNLGQRSASGMLGKAQFEMDPFLAEQLRTQNVTIETRLEELARTQPALYERLDAGINQGLNDSTISS